MWREGLGWTQMEAGIILRGRGAVNGIQRGLAPLDRQKIRQISKRIRIVDGARARIGIGIETGIDIVACSPPSGMP